MGLATDVMRKIQKLGRSLFENLYGETVLELRIGFSVIVKYSGIHM